MGAHRNLLAMTEKKNKCCYKYKNKIEYNIRIRIHFTIFSIDFSLLVLFIIVSNYSIAYSCLCLLLEFENPYTRQDLAKVLESRSGIIKGSINTVGKSAHELFEKSIYMH